MVERGVFEGQGPAEVAALLFWHLKGDEKGGAEEKACGEAPAALAAAALAGLERLIDHYDQPGTAYPPKPKPRAAPRRDYDHLARLGEWAS